MYCCVTSLIKIPIIHQVMLMLLFFVEAVCAMSSKWSKPRTILKALYAATIEYRAGFCFWVWHCIRIYKNSGKSSQTKSVHNFFKIMTADERARNKKKCGSPFLKFLYFVIQLSVLLLYIISNRGIPYAEL